MPCSGVMASVGTALQQFEFFGYTRYFQVMTPECAPSTSSSLPLVLLFPCGGCESHLVLRQSAEEWQTVAKRRCFALAAMEGVQGIFDVVQDLQAAGRGTMDIEYVEAVIDKIAVQSGCIDLSRVYATGISMGARFSSRLASELSHRIAAVAPVGGLQYPCLINTSRPVPIMAIHGDADPVNPFEGPPANSYWTQSVPAALGMWRQSYRCSEALVETRVSDAVYKWEYPDCDLNAQLILYRMEGGGHAWPGGDNSMMNGPGPEHVNAQLHASAAIMDFFLSHRLPEKCPEWAPVEPRLSCSGFTAPFQPAEECGYKYHAASNSNLPPSDAPCPSSSTATTSTCTTTTPRTAPDSKRKGRNVNTGRSQRMRGNAVCMLLGVVLALSEELPGGKFAALWD